jgi:uncharacterized protein YukE
VTVNPLVAGRLDGQPDSWSGVWIAEDIELIAQGIRNGSWIDSSLGVVGAGLDALAIVSDPVGVLLQYGVSWIIEHVKPLSQALDWLAGDPAQIAAHAHTWRNVAASLHDNAADLERAVRWDVADWGGSAGPAYRAWSKQQQDAVTGLAKAAETMAAITEGAGALIAAVRILVRDAIATCVSRLVVYAAEEVASLGVATPLVVEQVSTLVASWAAKIARWLKALLASLRRLMPIVRRLGELIDELKKVLSRLRSGAREPGSLNGERVDFAQTGGEFRKPRNDLDFEIRWADDAYDRIRASDDEIAAITRTAAKRGFSPEDIRMIKDHVFRDEHLLDLYSPATTGRFDANPRMAEAWIRLTEGHPHPSDFDLLEHERFESNYMRETGDPSYKRAHTAAINAGYTWDSEAAAADGLGYQAGR